MKAKCIWNIIVKEYRDNKHKAFISFPGLLVVSGFFFIPLFVDNGESMLEVVNNYMQHYPSSLGNEETRQIILIDLQFPLIVLFAAFASPFISILDSIVTEKEQRTIEYLFVLPLNDMEILAGKMGFSLLTGIILSWLLYISHIVFFFVVSTPAVALHLLSPRWLLIIFVLVPLGAALMNIIGTMIATKVKKVQTAVNLAALVLTPFAALLLLIAMGLIHVEIIHILAAAGVLFSIDLIGFKFALALFNRETILLR